MERRSGGTARIIIIALAVILLWLVIRAIFLEPVAIESGFPSITSPMDALS